jgi:hypothetical protein
VRYLLLRSSLVEKGLVGKVINLERPKRIPVILYPGDNCLVCNDHEHPNEECYVLKVTYFENGDVAIGPCSCDTSITAGSPGRYVVRVVQTQKE